MENTLAAKIRTKLHSIPEGSGSHTIVVRARTTTTHPEHGWAVANRPARSVHFPSCSLRASTVFKLSQRSPTQSAELPGYNKIGPPKRGSCVVSTSTRVTPIFIFCSEARTAPEEIYVARNFEGYTVSPQSICARPRSHFNASRSLYLLGPCRSPVKRDLVWSFPKILSHLPRSGNDPHFIFASARRFNTAVTAPCDEFMSIL